MDKASNKTFLDFVGDKYTYGEVDDITNRLAHSLADLGVQPGETVLTMFDNNIDAVAAWLAINKLRAVSVPVNTALRGEFLRHQAVDSGAAVILCEPDYVARFAGISDRLGNAKVILHRGKLAEPVQSQIEVRPLDDYRGTDPSALTVLPEPGDLAGLIYTSGTTGPSKGHHSGDRYGLHRAALLGVGLLARDRAFGRHRRLDPGLDGQPSGLGGREPVDEEVLRPGAHRARQPVHAGNEEDLAGPFRRQTGRLQRLRPDRGGGRDLLASGRIRGPGLLG